MNEKCKHEIGVQIYSFESEYKCNEVYCLECKENFNGPDIIFNKKFSELLPFKSIIHFENVDKGLSEIKKVEFAKYLFDILKDSCPNINEYDIVNLINNKVNENLKSNIKIKYKNR